VLLLEPGGDWDWAHMKEALRAIEDHELGDDGLRGARGALHVSTALDWQNEQ
jgi:choline dehydrogenase